MHLMRKIRRLHLPYSSGARVSFMLVVATPRLSRSIEIEIARSRRGELNP